MTDFHVSDLSVDEIFKEQYDIALFASGYEPRAIHVASVLTEGGVKYRRAIVFGFAENRDVGSRVANDEFFRSCFGSEPELASTRDDKHLYRCLSTTPADESHIRVLVDYSSMPRLWYGALLNWARYNERYARVTIDFVYSVGMYSTSIPPMVIKDLLAIPGFEGGGVSMYTSVAIFGLGYDTWGTLCALDLLEPDLTYCFIAGQGQASGPGALARELNRELIAQSKSVVELPLASVEISFAQLTELAAAYRSEADVSLVPMGPKPHALASMLVSMRFNDIACLRVSGDRTPLVPTETSGQIVASRVVFFRRSP